MLHIVPIVCLIFFIWFVEMQLKKELRQIEREFRELKERISRNTEKISDAHESIRKHEEEYHD